MHVGIAVCVCVRVSTPVQAETVSSLVYLTQWTASSAIKLQANLMPRDQHRHTWPIAPSTLTRCAHGRRKRCDDATHMNGRTTKHPP